MNVAVDATGKPYERLSDEKYFEMMELAGIFDEVRQRAILASNFDPKDAIRAIGQLKNMQHFGKVRPGELKPLKEIK